MRPKPSPWTEPGPTDFPDFPVAGEPKPARKPRRKQAKEQAPSDGGEILEPPPPPPEPFLDGRLELRSTEDVLGAYEMVIDATAQRRMPPGVAEVMGKLLSGAADLVKHKERPKAVGAGVSVTVTGAPQGAGGPFAVFAGVAPQPQLPAPTPEVPVIDLSSERREEWAEVRERK